MKWRGKICSQLWQTLGSLRAEVLWCLSRRCHSTTCHTCFHLISGLQHTMPNVNDLQRSSVLQGFEMLTNFLSSTFHFMLLCILAGVFVVCCNVNGQHSTAQQHVRFIRWDNYENERRGETKTQQHRAQCLKCEEGHYRLMCINSCSWTTNFMALANSRGNDTEDEKF